MKKEDLMNELSGLELSDEVFGKIYAGVNRLEGISRQGIESERDNYKNSLDQSNAKLQEYEKTIESLRKDNTMNAEVTKELDALKKQLKDNERKNAEALKDAQIKEVLKLAMGDKKFVNDFTENAIVGEIKTELGKENNYLGIKDIFDNITKDREGIFANVHQPANMAQNGKADNTSVSKEEFKKMKYKDRLDLYNSNKELYDSLVK